MKRFTHTWGFNDIMAGRCKYSLKYNIIYWTRFSRNLLWTMAWFPRIKGNVPYVKEGWMYEILSNYSHINEIKVKKTIYSIQDITRRLKWRFYLCFFFFLYIFNNLIEYYKSFTIKYFLNNIHLLATHSKYIDRYIYLFNGHLQELSIENDSPNFPNLFKILYNNTFIWSSLSVHSWSCIAANSKYIN